MKQAYFELDIIDLNEEGDGVGKRNGFTWFVRGGLPGDRVKCHALKANKRFGRAVAVQVLKPSSNRVEAPCRYFDSCGGCQIQNYDYAAQLAFKENMVKQTLTRIGGFEAVDVKPILSMETPYRFRNKGAYAVGEVEGRVVVGLYEKHSHKIVDVADCLIQEAQHADIIKAFKAYMMAFGIPAYKHRQKQGLIRHLVIRQSEATGEIMVTVVTHKHKLPMTQKLVEMLRSANPNIVSIVQNIQPEATSEILGDTCKMLFGTPYIVDAMGELAFQISPLSFYQVNSKQAHRLYQAALDAAALDGDDVVFDLFSGTGTLSLFLAQTAKAVYGVEMSAQAVEDANANKNANDLENVTFVLGRSEIIAPKLYAEGTVADVVVLDPPRAGCEQPVLEVLLDMLPRRVVYVSCKVSTMARDLKFLCESGAYTLEWAQPVDMFGHSTGVETVALLTRREADAF